MWLFELPQMRLKSDTRVETDDRQTDTNEFIELYRKKSHTLYQ